MISAFFVSIIFFQLQAKNESSLNSVEYKNREIEFLKNAKRGKFYTGDEVAIGYQYIIKSGAKKTIVFIPGFAETYLKYTELFLDFYDKGYSVFMMDLRGMGVSGGKLASRQIVHIDNFATYVSDAETFVNQVVTPLTGGQLIIAGHSTGGLVAAKLAATMPNKFEKMFLCAPLLGLNFRGAPVFIVNFVVNIAIFFGMGEKYLFGAKDRTPGDLREEKSLTSHSEIRIQQAHRIRSLYPETISSGPSYSWIKQVLVATNDSSSLARRLRLPILLFMMGDDAFVSNEAQRAFCKEAENCRLINIKKAKHEIFMESDRFRNLAMKNIFSFLL